MTTETRQDPQDGDTPPRAGAIDHPGGCGIMTCLTLAMVLGAVLLAAAVFMAVFRPGLTSNSPLFP